MDWADNDRQQAFRVQVRDFIAERLPDYYRRDLGTGGHVGPFSENWGGDRASEDAAPRQAAQDWAAALSERRWVAPHWPEEFNGGGLSSMEQFILKQEMARAGAPSVGGGGVSYFLGHHLARELVVHIFGDRIERLGQALEREGFWTLVRLRFVPVPFAVTNYGACLAGVSFGTYLSSTALALLPITFVYTYFAATLVGVAEADRAGVLRQLGLAVLLLLLLSFVPPRIMAWRRRKAQSRETEPPPPREDRS